MRIEADRDACISAGNCVMTAGEIFDQDDDGIVVVLVPEDSDAGCPPEGPTGAGVPPVCSEHAVAPPTSTSAAAKARSERLTMFRLPFVPRSAQTYFAWLSSSVS